MQYRFRFIFGLLALCLLGSRGLQAYFCGNYQLATAQFERTKRRA